MELLRDVPRHNQVRVGKAMKRVDVSRAHYSGVSICLRTAVSYAMGKDDDS